jgi:uncharacterized metal-binding protein YceD (DUF177 family)
VTPEFSRLVPLARLGRTPLRQEIAASPGERRRLAARFGLLALDRLAADVALSRQGDGTFLLDAAFEAEFTQECVVTLEPVAGQAAAQFALVYGPLAAAPEDGMAAGEGPAFEPLAGDAIDIGEAVAQELSLVLPEFPRHPEAALAAAPEAAPSDPRLAALARLKGEGRR